MAKGDMPNAVAGAGFNPAMGGVMGQSNQMNPNFQGALQNMGSMMGMMGQARPQGNMNPATGQPYMPDSPPGGDVMRQANPQFDQSQAQTFGNQQQQGGIGPNPGMLMQLMKMFGQQNKPSGLPPMGNNAFGPYSNMTTSFNPGGGFRPQGDNIEQSQLGGGFRGPQFPGRIRPRMMGTPNEAPPQQGQLGGQTQRPPMNQGNKQF